VRVAIAPAPLLPQWAPQRLARLNVAVLSHAEYVPTLTAAAALRVKAVVILTFDLVSGVRVTFDVGYLCANFGSRRPGHAHYGANLWRNNDGVPISRDIMPQLRVDLCSTGKNCPSVYQC